MSDSEADLAALAKGGRTNLVGFVLRLAGRIPFLFIAGRIYGPEALGRLAYAVLVVEFAAQLATLGLKRGLALQLTDDARDPGHSVWDAMQTFVRIPAGAALAAAVFGDSGTAIKMAAALLGGSLTATTHFAKSGTRAIANTSPEPFSNLALSFTEDVAVIGGTWLATTHPTAFLIAIAIFVMLALVLIRFVWKGVRRIFPKKSTLVA